MGRIGIKPLIVLAVAVVCALLITFGVLAALHNPVSGPMRTYTADFSDASGLHDGGDVRLRGVLVGKVSSVSVQREGDGDKAEVTFTVGTDHPITSTTRLSIKYQNLTGERFVEISPDSADGAPVSHVPMSRTTPSFDITSLFNGLGPVLGTLNPQDVNQLTRNLVSLLEGGGVGAEDMFSDLDRITANLGNRQQVISTLVDNVASVAKNMNDYNPQVVEFITNFDLLLDKTLASLNNFRLTAQYGPGFVDATNRLLAGLGLAPDMDLDQFLSDLIKDPQSAAAALRRLPGVFSALSALVGDPGPKVCSHGEAPLPSSVKIFFGGASVTVCAR
ncbi:MlaD family protein [Tsukamurella sp. 8F]|uniref:MlaD family protein n=1 Tax=unclassified Tsukamurella TaxID=2633480 RepID=UPI0023B8D75A|nr:MULTISPECIES: MlaD family protein [unclassified Tsukamurella]MDF0530745.1 MlaD family protein [Tsukamurella sp. 8J]MDF0587946.1 MlaD family protein [Tsukamurella sp. 8F]